MNIETYISELLYRHDCVILPGLGGLITNYRSAKIHPVSHTIQPPSKSIRFNVNLKEDDGLLVNYLASCEAISYASAQSKIERFVFTIKNNLEHKKEAKLSKIGTLHLDVNDTLSFEPDTEVNYLLNSFGLDAVQSPPIMKKSTTADLSKQIHRGAKTIQSQKTTLNFLKLIRTINFLFQGFVFPIALGSRQSVGRSRRVAVVAVRAARAAAFFFAKFRIRNLASDAAKF